MFKLVDVYEVDNFIARNPSDRPIRCRIQADNTTDPLPKDGTDVEGMEIGQKILPGSYVYTPNFDIAIMGNDGEWGDWL